MTQFYRVVMPPIRRSNLCRKTCNSINQTNYRSNQIADQREHRNEVEQDRLMQIIKPIEFSFCAT